MAGVAVEGRAAVQELFKAAAGNSAFDIVIPGGNGITQGLIWNQTKDLKDLVPIAKHNWAGNVSKPYPDPIVWSKQGQPAIFVHEGLLPKGSKGGVVYADGRESTDRKWLVAFDCVANKVYVEAGAMGDTDWDNVEVRLGLSGSESSSEDPAYGGKAYATIEPVEGRSLVKIWFSA